MDGTEYISAFDVVCYIIKHHRKVLAIHVAEKFKMDIDTVKEIYHGLEIYPLEVPIEITESTGVRKVYADLDKVKKILGKRVTKQAIATMESGHEKVKSRIIIRSTRPNREEIKRPATKYTNIDSSIYGIAKKLHSGEDIT